MRETGGLSEPRTTCPTPRRLALHAAPRRRQGYRQSSAGAIQQRGRPAMLFPCSPCVSSGPLYVDRGGTTAAGRWAAARRQDCAESAPALFPSLTTSLRPTLPSTDFRRTSLVSPESCTSCSSTSRKSGPIRLTRPSTISQSDRVFSAARSPRHLCSSSHHGRRSCFLSSGCCQCRQPARRAPNVEKDDPCPRQLVRGRPRRRPAHRAAPAQRGLAGRPRGSLVPLSALVLSCLAFLPSQLELATDSPRILPDVYIFPRVALLPEHAPKACEEALSSPQLHFCAVL